MPRKRGESWLGALEDRLKTVFGPAQVSRLEGQVPRSENRTSGVGGDWVIRRDAAGVPYLEATTDPTTPSPMSPSEGTTPSPSGSSTRGRRHDRR